MTDPTVQAVRAFNRFYTRQIGVLGEKHLESQFSLTETRVLYELAHRDQPTASEIARELGLDAGYLSRILLRFQKRRLLARQRSAIDARQSHLQLTKEGRQAFAPLDQGASRQVGTMLGRLSDAGRAQLVEAMHTIEGLLAGAEGRSSEIVLRGHRPGDMGWVVHRHGVLYAQEYGWDERFEALVAEIAARFIQNFDAARERCWIAEKDGAMAGSVFLVRASDEVAKLRLLLVEPWARGSGTGRRLVEECIAFARECGYRKITLWTQEVLLAARRIYEKAGFRVTGRERQRLFGPEMTAETWELEL
jgi:DNA-binding MarR family transcriptional regulator/N-acetylglutamate synthase-like GNAT family acetyltransferase